MYIITTIKDNIIYKIILYISNVIQIELYLYRNTENARESHFCLKPYF
jgi:hypothetical protein